MTGKKGALLLGIDLGGTKVLTAVVDGRGKMLSSDHVPTRADKGQEALIRYSGIFRGQYI